jgi:hypothetical protein
MPAAQAWPIPASRRRSRPGKRPWRTTRSPRGDRGPEGTGDSSSGGVRWRQWRGAARCGVRAKAGGLNTRLGLPVGDAVMTTEILAVLRRLEARAYGGMCLGAPRDGALRGARASGRGVARASRSRGVRARTPRRGRRQRRTGRARRRARRTLALAVLLVLCLINCFSKILNKT